VADPREQAARSMMQAGITSLGANRSPRFEPEINYYGVDREYFPRTPGGADRIDYGYGQMMNPQGGARQIGPWLDDDYYVNPNIFEKQKGLASFPGGARTFAERHRSGDFTNWDDLGDLRNMVGWMSNLGAPVDSPVDEYGYNLSELPDNWDPDMFKSKREQIEDEENSFVANMMEMYGRDNPYTQDLSKTTPGKGVFRDLGYSARSPADIAYGYEENLDPELALPPENIGMDRAPEEILSAPEDPSIINKFKDYLQRGIDDIPDYEYGQILEASGDSYDQMRYELRRIGIDPTGMGNDEIKQIYDINIGGTTGEEDQFGIV
jgi:hypothetical protein